MKKNRTVRIKNWFDFSNLNQYILHWNVTADNGMVLAKGMQEVDCLPHGMVNVMFGAVKLPVNTREAYLNLSWMRKTVFLLW